MAEMTAKYPGTCAKTGERIRKGDLIDYDRGTRQAVLIKSMSTTMQRYAKTDYAIARRPWTEQVA